ncbi:phosphotransferase family protein [Streptomyces sp. INA 01156]
MSHRKPSLLHGDLNPWNLVRRGDAFALTLIDWEMALVGDPLHDLVRHMHLTPTRRRSASGCSAAGNAGCRPSTPVTGGRTGRCTACWRSCAPPTSTSIAS